MHEVLKISFDTANLYKYLILNLIDMLQIARGEFCYPWYCRFKNL